MTIPQKFDKMYQFMDDQPVTPNQIHEAIVFIQDLLDRSQIRFFALKDTAREIRASERGIEPDLHLSNIELGIRKLDLTETGSVTLRDLFRFYKVSPDWTDGLIRFEYKGVPVTIRIIQRNYQFLKNPNINFYRTLEFLTPNPFDRYWIARSIVR